MLKRDVKESAKKGQRPDLRVVLCNLGDSDQGRPRSAAPLIDTALLGTYLKYRKEAKRPAFYPVQMLANETHEE